MLEEIVKKILSQLSPPGLSRGLNFIGGFAYQLYGRVLIVSVTTRCNFNCPHCLRREVDEKKTLIKDLPISVFETALENGKKLNFRMVSFTGGEPILHSQFEELVFLTVKHGYKFNFVSNNWLYKNYSEIIKKYRKNLQFVFLSLDGVTPEVHDSVRNKPGSFNRVMEAVSFYRQKGIPIIANFCATRKNFHQIEKFPDFCLGLGIKSIKWIAAIPAAGESDIAQEHLLTEQERTAAIGIILNLKKKFRFRCDFQLASNFFSLNFGKANAHFNICPPLNCNFLYIDHDGGMFFCCDINRYCKNKPLIQEIGFEESVKITLNAANEMKKKILSHLLNNPQKIGRICDFCNENIESCMDIAAKNTVDNFLFIGKKTML